MPAYPAAFLLDASEEVDVRAYPKAKRALTVEVQGRHAVPYTDDGDPGKVGTYMIADIERAVMQDLRRAENAVMTMITRTSKEVDFPAEPFVTAGVLIEIDYGTLLTDPGAAL